MKKKNLNSYKERDRAMVRAIVGANWGDEGKGKITDMLAETSDIIVRFQGGSNAGHTIINNYGKFALHLLPSGVFYGHTTSIIGNGVALNIPYLVKEINSLIEKGVPKPKVLVSDRAQIIMPYHIKFDEYEEERLGKNSFGSTKSGIAPFYSDKYAKIGFQVNELFDDNLFEKVQRVVELKNVILENLYKKEKIDAKELYDHMLVWRDAIKPYVCDVSKYLNDAIKDSKKILLEGQLGSLKDTDHGIYPMVTSSSTLAGYGSIGAGIPPYEITDIVTVVKAYSSAVGAGAFVSEIFGEEAEELRKRGGDKGEYGATTGRPRRVGYFDAVASRYGCRVQGSTEAVLTVIDALGYLEEIPVCIGYEIDGEVTRDFPTSDKLEKAEDFNQAVHDLIIDTLTEHRRIIFNGNGYSEEWVKEAARRGLPNTKSMVEAIPSLIDDHTIEVFAREKVLNRTELESRAEIQYEKYTKTINIEAKTMIDMVRRLFIPAVIKYQTVLAKAINEMESTGLELECSMQKDLLKKVSLLLAAAGNQADEMENMIIAAKKLPEGREQAEAFNTKVAPAMTELRESIDSLEVIVGRDYWPVPTYSDILFEV